MQQSIALSVDGRGGYGMFKNMNLAVSSIFGMECGLKPEVSLAIELYEAERSGYMLSASTVGLESGIPQSSTIRYIRYMEENGWVTRTPHEFDRRVSFLRLCPMTFQSLERVFQKHRLNELVSYKPAV